jgi:hypothetical protein
LKEEAAFKTEAGVSWSFVDLTDLELCEFGTTLEIKSEFPLATIGDDLFSRPSLLLGTPSRKTLGTIFTPKTRWQVFTTS